MIYMDLFPLSCDRLGERASRLKCVQLDFRTSKRITKYGAAAVMTELCEIPSCVRMIEKQKGDTNLESKIFPNF